MAAPTAAPTLAPTLARHVSRIAYHGTAPGAPLVGGRDVVSWRQRMTVLWASDSYDLAAQFQDGEIRKLRIDLRAPLIVPDSRRRDDWFGLGHACIVDRVMARVAAGGTFHDGVIFPDTIDGMEVGDVIAVFSRQSRSGALSVRHAVELLGLRTYDEDLDDWVSMPGFDTRSTVLQHGRVSVPAAWQHPDPQSAGQAVARRASGLSLQDRTSSDRQMSENIP